MKTIHFEPITEQEYTAELKLLREQADNPSALSERQVRLTILLWLTDLEERGECLTWRLTDTQQAL